MSGLEIERLGEDALLLRLGSRIDEATNARVHALAALIDARRPPWLVDIVPAHATLALFIDADLLDGRDPIATGLPLERAEHWLRSLGLEDAADVTHAGPPEAVIPVVYGGEYGPDLKVIAVSAGLAPQAVADLVEYSTWVRPKRKCLTKTKRIKSPLRMWLVWQAQSRR